jgi:transposase-like protein
MQAREKTQVGVRPMALAARSITKARFSSHGHADVIVTDGLRSYPAAMRGLSLWDSPSFQSEAAILNGGISAIDG